MPQDNALSALRKAETIGADPKGIGNADVSYGMMMPPIGGIFGALKNLVGMGGEATEAATAVPKVASLASEASHRIVPVAETLGEVNPDFTPTGGEELFNAARSGLHKAMDPVEAAYHTIMSRMGKP